MNVKYDLPLTEDDIKAELRTRVLGHVIYAFQTIGSTNNYAKKLVASGKAREGMLIIADRQTRGRGRVGNRKWHSLPGMGLWFTFILRPDAQIEKIPLLTYLVSAAVGEAIEEETRVNIDLKWPNDIMIDGKKCCGILLESDIRHPGMAGRSEPFVIVGIGINVNHRRQDFSEELRDSATSLRMAAGGRKVTRLTLLCRVLEKIETYYQQDFIRAHYEKIINNWKMRSSMLGEKITVVSGHQTLEGIADNILPDGQLQILLRDGKKITLFAGTVI